MKCSMLLPAFVVALSCGVNAPPSGGDDNLPNAKVGPFRVLREGEMPPQDRVFPFALRRKGTRNPSALQDGAHVKLYVASSESLDPEAPPIKILRFDAADGRSFHPREPDAVVLEPSESWEGGVVDAPSVLRVGSEIWMFYAAMGGIGLAVSADGTTFVKRVDPVLKVSADATWEQGNVPSDPSVVMLGEGSFCMFYEAGAGIGEAVSEDGVRWRRVAGAPALWPVPPPAGPAPEEDSVDEPFDDVSVADPHALVDTSSLGRGILRVYYAGSNRLGVWSLGMAARYDGETTLQRAHGRVLGSDHLPRGPAVLRLRDVAMLYFTAPADREPESASAIAIGVAPATASLSLE